MPKPIISYAMRVEAPGHESQTLTIGARGWSARQGGRNVYLDGWPIGRDVNSMGYSPARAAEMLTRYVPGRTVRLLASDVRTRKPFFPGVCPA